MNNFLDLHRRFLRYCAIEEGLSQNTLNDLKSKISTFAKRTGIIQVSEVQLNVVREFFYEGSEHYQWSYSTYTNYHKYLKKFFAWCVENGHMKENPILQIKRPKKPKTLPRRLSEEEVYKILSTAFTMPCRYQYEQVRNYAILATYLYTGLRLSELTRLQVGDVDLEQGLLFVSQAKGKKDRLVPIHFKLKSILRRYLNERQKAKKESPYLFVGAKTHAPLTATGIKRIYEKVSQASGVRFTIHQLRHTFASKAAEQNLPLPQLQQILGHSNIQSTMIYLEMSQRAIKDGLNAVELF